MTTIRNPKQAGSVLYDCIPQAGQCPMGCNQCFFNRSGAFYTETPSVPDPADLPEGAIVRMNCGHDSNIDRELVIGAAKRYLRFFFNTAIPRFEFPGPVVLTANPKEECTPRSAPEDVPSNLMFVRLRVSATNLAWIHSAVDDWTGHGVPIVLTFMAYYDHEPEVPASVAQLAGGPCYEWRVRHVNSYWCATPAFIKHVLIAFRHNRLVTMCGSVKGALCKDCRNCETYYIQTIKRMADHEE